MASPRQCRLNQFADRSVCSNQNNFHRNSYLPALDLRHTAIDCQLEAGDVAAFVEARKSTAEAISSGVPVRPIGTLCTLLAPNSCACCSLRPILPKIGVAIGPGLNVLTRILRSFRSEVQLRAKDRTAAFVAA